MRAISSGLSKAESLIEQMSILEAGDPSKVHVPQTGPIRKGDWVKVVFGSGLDSDKEGTVIGFQKHRLGREAIIKQKDGSTITMFVDRLFHPPKKN